MTTHRPLTKTLHERPLPNGWRWVRLGDHARKIGSGFTPPGGQASYLKVGVPLIRSQNVHMNRFTLDGIAFISEEQDALMRESRVQSGDILLNITGASIGRVCVVPDDITPANVNQHVSVIRADDSFNPEFLSFYISTPNFQKYIFDTQAGATRQALTKGLIEGFQVPLPPLPEQRWIAAILKEQMAVVEKARAAVQERLEAVMALPAAFLRRVFPQPGQPLPHGWRWVRLDEVFMFLDYLRKPISEIERGKRIEGRSFGNLYPYYGANGQAGWIDDYLFDEPLVLLAEDGGAFGSFNTPIAYKIEGKTWVNNHAHVLRPRPGVDLDFALAAIAIRPDLANLATGNTRPKLNQALASAIPVPLPSFSKQRRIAEILKEQMAAVEKARAAAESELAAIEALPAALLRRAFNGEL